MYRLADYDSAKIAVRVDNEEEYQLFVSICYERGYLVTSMTPVKYPAYLSGWGTWNYTAGYYMGFNMPDIPLYELEELSDNSGGVVLFCEDDFMSMIGG